MTSDRDQFPELDEGLSLAPSSCPDTTGITDVLPASPEELKALYQVADQALGVLVSGSGDFVYSLPVQTPLGAVRIQKTNGHLGIVRFEVRQKGGDSTLTFTLSANGRLVFDVPESARPERVAMDTAHGVFGILSGIAQNAAAAQKPAEMNHGAALQLMGSLQAEVTYYQDGQAQTDLKMLEDKMDWVNGWAFALPEEAQRKVARNKLAEPYTISVPVMGQLMVNFDAGTITTSDGQSVLRLGSVGIVQDFMSEEANGLYLPQGVLRSIMAQVKAIQPAL